MRSTGSRRYRRRRWGRIQLTIGNAILGDNIVAQLGVFQKQADVGYVVDGGFMIWPFEFISISEIFGNGYNVF